MKNRDNGTKKPTKSYFLYLLVFQPPSVDSRLFEIHEMLLSPVCPDRPCPEILALGFSPARRTRPLATGRDRHRKPVTRTVEVTRVDTVPSIPSQTDGHASCPRALPVTIGFRALHGRTPPSLANAGQKLYVDTEPSFLYVPVAVQKGIFVT